MFLNKEILIGIYDFVPANLIWTGLGVNNNWSTNNNWNIKAPVPYDVLQFAGTTRLTPFNDLAVDTNLNGVAFNAGAGAFAISGNRFVLNAGDITNNSSNTQQINNDIILGSSAGNINCNSAPMFLNRNISGTGNLTKIGTSSLSLSGNNSYTGDTFIRNGFVSVFNSNPFGTGNVYLQSPNILLGQYAFTISNNAVPANVIINSPIYISGISGPGAVGFSVSKNSTFNQPIILSNSLTVGNQNCNININGNTTVTFNGGISAGPSWKPTWVQLGGLNNDTAILSGAPVIIDNSSTMFSLAGSITTIIAVTGNKFQTFRNFGNVRFDVPLGINDETVTMAFQNITQPAINLNGNSQVFRNTSCNYRNYNIFNNSSTFANLTANNTATSTYTGSISGNINLIKTGTGSLTLSGDTALNIGPRYTGFTAISAGNLINYALSSNPSNKVNFARFTNTALTVDFLTPPTIGNSFVLLPGITINSYPAITLTNAGGRAGSYNSSTSTLSITS